MKFKSSLAIFICFLFSLAAASHADIENPEAKSPKTSGDKSLLGELNKANQLVISRFQTEKWKKLASVPHVVRYAMTANASHFAVMRKSNGKVELEVYKTSPLELKYRKEMSHVPERIWLSNDADVIGLYFQSKFTAYSLSETDMRTVYSESSIDFFPSPSGNFLFFQNEEGRLKIIKTATWESAARSSDLIQSTFKKWLTANRPGARGSSDGAFVFPKKISGMSFDDRLITVALGENDQTFLNICASTGEITSIAAFDVRVNTYSDFDETGNYFGVLITPNTDDSKFKRPAQYFGIHIFNAFDGNKIAVIPLGVRYFSGYKRLGASYFSDNLRWFSFLQNGKKGELSGVMLNGASIENWNAMPRKLSLPDTKAQSLCRPL